MEFAEAKCDLAISGAVEGTDAEQTEVAVKYLTGDELGNRGVVFSDFQGAGAEVPGAVNPARGNVGFADTELKAGGDVLGFDGRADT